MNPWKATPELRFIERDHYTEHTDGPRGTTLTASTRRFLQQKFKHCDDGSEKWIDVPLAEETSVSGGKPDG